MSDERSILVRGDTVVRPVAPWTATIHSLLAHLYAQGLPVPEPLEFTADHEVVRFVPGDTVDDAKSHEVSLARVRSAGQLLRKIHEGTRTWRAPVDAVWSVPAEGGEIICHGDPKPANMAWCAEDAIGLFDWDSARPADALSDVAYALTWFARRDREDYSARVDALLDGYGWEGPFDPVADVRNRRLQAIDEVEYLARAGYEPERTWVEQGWPETWRKEMEPRTGRLTRSGLSELASGTPACPARLPGARASSSEPIFAGDPKADR